MANMAGDRAAPRMRGQMRAVATLGLPLIGSQVAQYAITLTDTVMIGWYGVTELAALTIAGPMWFILFILGSGFALAVMPMVASAAAQEDEVQVRRITRMGLWLSLGYGALVTPLLLFAEPILLAIGQAPDVAELAGQYLVIAGFGLVPALLTMVLRSYLAALEHTAIVFWITVVAAIANGFVNYALIFGNWGAPELGVAGAAIASLTVHMITTIFLAGYAILRTPQYALFVRFWRPDWGAIRQVSRLGVPIGLTNLAEVGLFSASSVMLGWIGVIELAAHGIALSIASATFMVHIALSQAATVRAGQAYGRRDPAALRSAAMAAFVLSGLMVVLTIAVFLGIPEVLAGLFVDPSDPELPFIMPIAVTLLAFAALFQVADAAQVMMLGVLRGMQDTRRPMIIAVISYWLVGAPVAYVLGFPLGLGPEGVWLGLATGLAVAALLLGWRLFAVMLPALSAEASEATP